MSKQDLILKEIKNIEEIEEYYIILFKELRAELKTSHVGTLDFYKGIVKELSLLKLEHIKELKE